MTQNYAKATVYYFNENGKYKYAGELEILPEDTADNGNLVLMYKLDDKLRELSRKCQLPGVSSDWLQQKGYIYCNHDNGYPILVISITKMDI